MVDSKVEKSVNEIEGLEMVPKNSPGPQKRPKFEEHIPKKMDREEANKEMDEFFVKLEEELKDVPKEVIEHGAKKVIDFIKGKMTWGEIFNINPKMMKKITEIGYMKYQAGRLEEAERFFKVLSILDSRNSYFKSMLGSILQRQKRYGEAVAHFSDAIELNPNDIISLVNRGEILMNHGWLNDAESDFEKASSLDPAKENKWANKARLLLKKVLVLKQRKQTAPKSGAVAKEKEVKGKKIK